MQTRCPFSDCTAESYAEDELEFKALVCNNCSRSFTARSLARHIEIDKQVIKHKKLGSHAEQFFASNKQPGKMLVILEEIRSLWNVGSIFRTADGAGFSHLFLLGITGCPPRKEIAKTSLGAEEHVGWSYAGSSLEIISPLKNLGYQIISLEKTEKSMPVKEAIDRELLQTPFCLVLGSEVKGVYKETLEASDLVLDLPMRGFKESLNVAVAFGIAAYSLSEKLS